MPKHQTMKTYRGLEMNSHAFLTSVLGRREWSASRSVRIASGYNEQVGESIEVLTCISEVPPSSLSQTTNCFKVIFSLSEVYPGETVRFSSNGPRPPPSKFIPT